MIKFKPRNTRALAEMVVGDGDGPKYFKYRSSSRITEFFQDCDLDFVHDGTTRWSWAASRLEELLAEPQPNPNALPDRFVNLLRVLMDKTDAQENDPNRELALSSLNKPLLHEGYEAFYDEENQLHIRHVKTKSVSYVNSPHRPLTQKEIERKEMLASYLSKIDEDTLIEEILLPLFRQLGFHKVTAVGHKDKSLEYGKDMWMKYVLPTQNILYFGIQAKIDKIDSAGKSRGSNQNISEIHQQVLMMLGHEVFDTETNKKALVDHAYIISGGEITKQARNWLVGMLDASKRSQIMFMDKNDILDLYIVNNLPLPSKALPEEEFKIPCGDDIPF